MALMAYYFHLLIQMLGIEPRTLYMLSMYSTAELHPNLNYHFRSHSFPEFTVSQALLLDHSYGSGSHIGSSCNSDSI